MKMKLSLTIVGVGFFALSQVAYGQFQQYCDDQGNTALGTVALFFNTTGVSNTAVGFQSLLYNNNGSNNTAAGYDSLFTNSSGNNNTANGYNAQYSNSSGSNNTASGRGGLYNNTTASNNTATGYQALNQNTTGTNKTADGFEALQNSAGSNNTATGYQPMFGLVGDFLPTGSDNTAIGYQALNQNTMGHDSVASGYQALRNNTTSNYNTAYGNLALSANTTVSYNTATGYKALSFSTGAYNTATGVQALYGATGSNNTAIGFGALYLNATGSKNIAVGNTSGYYVTSGTYNIDIGNIGAEADSATIRIGATGNQTNTYIAGVNGVAVAGGVGVLIDSDGHLGTIVSSERFKENSQPMDKASEAILALLPVAFRYKHDLDPKGIPQVGLVAEQVEKVNSDLVARDDQGKAYSVRYEAVNAMLLNEFLKEDRKVEKLEGALAQQTERFAEQEKEIKALSAGLQKVSNQLATASLSRVGAELAKPAPRVVVNNIQNQ